MAPSRPLLGVPSSAISVSSIFGLLLGVHAADGVEDLAVDGGDRLLHALAEVARLVAIAQFDRLVRAGRGARRHGGAAERAVLQHDVDLDGRIAAAIEDFAADDVDDGGHEAVPVGFARVIHAAQDNVNGSARVAA